MTFQELVTLELDRARFGNKPINSLHEGYAVILEELDEFWAELKKNSRDRDLKNCVVELVQIAAMAQRTCEDIFGKNIDLET